MPGFLNGFSLLDLLLIVAISLFCGLMLRRWSALAWMVMAALAADFALPLLYFLATGDGWGRAGAAANARFLDRSGGMLVLRAFCYFGLIASVFFIKNAWKRR